MKAMHALAAGLLMMLVALLGAPLGGAHGDPAGALGLGAGQTQAPTVLDLSGTVFGDDGPGIVPIGDGYASGLPAWDGDSSHGFEFKCPDVNESVYTLPGCPAYVLDPEDIMSQPDLAIDPVDPNIMAFHALHGGRGVQALPGDEPPTERSRADKLHQPHTVFQKDQPDRFTWQDRKYYSPWHCEPASPADVSCQDTPDIYGEDNRLALDAQGRMTVASLYAVEMGDGGFDYRIVVWNADRTNRLFESTVGYAVLSTEAPGNVADSLDLAYASTTNRMVVLWRESAPDGAVGENGLSSWVSASYAKPGDGARWFGIDAEERFGPCDAISNGVPVQDLVFVACKPGSGFGVGDGNVSVNADEWQLFTLNTRNWTTAWHSSIPVRAGSHGILADTGYGHLVFAASGIDEEGNPVAVLNAGDYVGTWYSPEPLGAKLTNLTDPLTVQDVRVTALAYKEETHHIHLIYMERYEAGEESGGVLARQYYKALANVAVTKESFDWLGKQDLGLGNGPRHFSAQYQGASEHVFSDLHDSIVIWPERNGNNREFIAYGDYGNVRFAEVEELDETPALGFPLVSSPPPVPLAAPGANPAYVGIVAGALSAAMVARILAAKKKQAAETPSL